MSTLEDAAPGAAVGETTASPKPASAGAPATGAAPPPGTAPVAAATAPGAAPGTGLPGARFLKVNTIAAIVGVASFAAALAIPGTRASTTAAPGASAATNGNALALPLWDDGRAEVARYDAERVVYGRAQKYELVQVLVKELFDPATRTKPEVWRAGAIDALKLLRAEDVPSGRAYQYRQTLALRVARLEPERLLDATAGSQEWCGNAFALLVPRDGSLLRHVHSYWDGEGDREDRLDRGVWLEDQLPATLRGLALAPGFSKDVALLPSIVSNKHPASRAPMAAKIMVVKKEELATGVGSRAALLVHIARADDATLDLWFGEEVPHPLLKYGASDGRKGVLRSIDREVYWRDDPSKPCAECEAGAAGANQPR